MNTDIANILKDQLKNLEFVDRIAGLVRPMTKVDTIEVDEVSEMKVVKVFPVACGVSQQDCDENEMYFDLVPNSEKRSIMYFEDRGCVPTGIAGDLMTFVSNLRLVGWLNMDMFATKECSVSAAVIASIIEAIRKDRFNHGVYQRMQIALTSIEPKSPAIFAQYSYSEETNQYLLYPFDYFAINFSIEFAIRMSCIPEILIKDKSCLTT